MQLTPEQKEQYNRYRAEGLPQDQALRIATQDTDNKFNPVLEAGTQNADGVLFGKNSLSSSVIGGVKEAAIGGFREVYDDTKKYGAGVALAKSPLSLLAGVGRGVGEVIGGVAETADDLTGEVVSNAATPYMEKLAGSERFQGFVQKAQDFDEATFGVGGDVLDVLNLAGVAGGVKAAGSQTVKNAFKAAASKSDDAVKSVASTVSRVAPEKKTVTSLSDRLNPIKSRTPEQYSDQAYKAAAELLQSGSKKNAIGRNAKYNNADTQAMHAIRDSKVELKSQQDLVKFFDDEITAATKARDHLLNPHLSKPVDFSYSKTLRDEILNIKKTDEVLAGKYTKYITAERELFEKVAKQSPGGNASVAYLSNRVKEMNQKVSKLYNDVGGKDNLLPEQQIEAQAYELIRKGLKKELDAIGGKKYAEAGTKTSGLLDAKKFSQIQRDRAKNALSDIPWETMKPTERALFIKEHFPTIKDFGVSKLVKLDTKADVLDGLVEPKVNLIREFGAKAALE